MCSQCVYPRGNLKRRRVSTGTYLRSTMWHLSGHSVPNTICGPIGSRRGARTSEFRILFTNFALRTPSRVYLSKEIDWSKLTSHLPRENKKCICPLCGDIKPDTWHYSTQCSFTDNLRAETQAATGALLTGICSLGVYDPKVPDILAAWFQHNFMDITGPDAVEICNATAGSGSPASALHWDGTVDWPLMLCSTKTLSNFLKLPGRPHGFIDCTSWALSQRKACRASLHMLNLQTSRKPCLKKKTFVWSFFVTHD